MKEGRDNRLAQLSAGLARRAGLWAYRHSLNRTARRLIVIATRQNPADVVAALYLARAQRDQGNPQLALETMERALGVYPGWAPGVWLAAKIHLKMEDRRGARAVLNTLGPLEDQDRVHLGRISRLAGRIGDHELETRLSLHLLIGELRSMNLVTGEDSPAPEDILPTLVELRRERPRDRKLGLMIHRAARLVLLRDGVRTDRPSVEAFGGWLIPPSPDPGRQNLVIIERGADPELLGAYLDACADTRLVAESPDLAESAPGHPIQPAGSLVPVGMQDDFELCRDTDRIAATLWEVIDKSVARRYRRYAGIDLLDQLSFSIDDRVFQIGRTVRALSTVIRSGEFARIAFVAGKGRLSAALLPVAEQAVGSENVDLLWAPDQRSRSLRRKGRGGTSSGEDDPLQRPAVVPGDPAEVGDQAEPRPERGLVMAMASPHPRFTKTVGAIAAELASTHRTSFVIPNQDLAPFMGVGGKPSNNLVQLVNRDPATFSLTVCEATLRSRRKRLAFKKVTEKIVKDPDVEQLELDGARLVPLLEPGVSVTLRRLEPLGRFATGLEQFVKENAPEALIVCPDRTPEARTACSIGRACGIPSVYPFAVLIGNSPRHKPLQADYGTLMDEGQVALYERMQAGGEGRLAAAGLPGFDKTTNARLKLVAEGREGNGAEPRRPMVALVLQPLPPDHNERLIDVVVRSAHEAGAEVEVRPHPGESEPNRRRYAAQLEALPGAPRINDGDLIEMLLASTLVVSCFSNVLVQAAILGRLSLSVNLTGDEFPVQLGSLGIAVESDGERDTHEAIQRLLADDEGIAAALRLQDAYFERNPHLREGSSARRIARIIAELPATPVA